MSNEATFARRVATTQEGYRWWLFTACGLVSLTNEASAAVMNLSLGPMCRDLGRIFRCMEIGCHPWQADARRLYARRRRCW